VWQMHTLSAKCKQAFSVLGLVSLMAA